MVNKFAASFQALREALTTGEPFIRVYDEPRMASEALREFEQVHDGHETSVRLIGEDIVTTCLVCGDDFREQYS